ncbi:histidine kinase dimerization/phospho-acceptor domain-containing protein [Virgibacillus proomii]|jgi:two-component system, OmpR family, lantibiotic biosynthesis sensor histidine kinase NisK/SpaK|uniref:histidine kinase dimerization/phospho-acceptor domain-containing protein n=1 Tax=Virgibacillus proomii TaxID=84407 RepID=UPI0009864C3C
MNEVISTLDKLKMELSTSLERQWDVDQKLYRTLQAVSHDIRTPITLISGNLDLLKETELSTN